MDYFEDINKLILKFTWKYKRSRTANTKLKKNKAGELNTTQFQNLLYSYGNQDSMLLEEEHINQQNTRESSEIKLQFNVERITSCQQMVLEQIRHLYINKFKNFSNPRNRPYILNKN